MQKAKAARRSRSPNGESKARIATALRGLVATPGYAYLKDIAFSQADALMFAVSTNKQDRLPEVGGLTRGAFLRLFTTVETTAKLSPNKKPIELLAVEKETFEIL